MALTNIGILGCHDVRLQTCTYTTWMTDSLNSYQDSDIKLSLCAEVS